jgi:ATP-dependent DNA helicase 2 subunit 2
MKQALFHSAVIEDLAAEPLPPPHPELTKYFEPPKKVLRRAKDVVDECKDAFAVKKGVP